MPLANKRVTSIHQHTKYMDGKCEVVTVFGERITRAIGVIRTLTCLNYFWCDISRRTYYAAIFLRAVLYVIGIRINEVYSSICFDLYVIRVKIAKDLSRHMKSINHVAKVNQDVYSVFDINGTLLCRRIGIKIIQFRIRLNAQHSKADKVMLVIKQRRHGPCDIFGKICASKAISIANIDHRGDFFFSLLCVGSVMINLCNTVRMA